MVCLKKANGEVIWKYASPEADKAAYASAIVVETGGVKQYVQLSKGAGRRRCEDRQTTWRYTGIIKDFSEHSDARTQQGHRLWSTAKGGGGFVRLKKSDSGVEAEEVFAGAKLPTAIGGSVEVNGYLYGTGSGALMCVEVPSGEVKWQSEGRGRRLGLLCRGRLMSMRRICRARSPSWRRRPEAYKELGRFTPPNGPTNRSCGRQRGAEKRSADGKTWAYPVIANGKPLYSRLELPLVLRCQGQKFGLRACAALDGNSLAPQQYRSSPGRLASPGS